MSCGVFRTPEKPYVTINGEIPGDIFAKTDLFDTALRRFIAGGLGFGDKMTDCVRVEIACLLEEIQRVSFIPLDDAQRVKTKPYPGTCESGIADDMADAMDTAMGIHSAEGEQGLDSSTYIATLNPEKLIDTIRLQLQRIFQACATMYHPDHSEIYSRIYTNSIGNEEPDQGEGGKKDVNEVQFLTSLSRAHVKAIGGISPENVNDMARTFAKDVLARSKLSVVSFRSDMMDVGRGIKKSDEPELIRLEDGTVVISESKVRYSTLNPHDLIELFRFKFRFLPMEIKTRMDSNALEAVMAKEGAYDTKHKV